MVRKSNSKIANTVEALKHDEARRKNIPTTEYQSVIQKEEEKPKDDQVSAQQRSRSPARPARES